MSQVTTTLPNVASQNRKLRLSLLLWSAGFIGVLTLLLVPLPELVDVEISTATLQALQIVQSSILLGIAVVIGTLTAPKIGLSAPAAEAVVTGHDPRQALWAQMRPGLLWGLAAGLLGVVVGYLAQPALLANLGQNLDVAGDLPMATRLLYGGITEELLLRWGMMSFLAWLIWRIFQRGHGQPKAVVMWTAVAGAALLFGIGHLPFAMSLAETLTPFLFSYVVGLNAALALIFGWLYWRKGLEAAMMAHMMFHIVVVSANWILTL